MQQRKNPTDFSHGSVKEMNIKSKYHDKICSKFKETVMNFKIIMLKNSVISVMGSGLNVSENTTVENIKNKTLDEFMKKRKKKC